MQEWLNYITSEVHKGFSPLWGDNDPAVNLRVEQLQKKFDWPRSSWPARST